MHQAPPQPPHRNQLVAARRVLSPSQPLWQMTATNGTPQIDPLTNTDPLPTPKEVTTA